MGHTWRCSGTTPDCTHESLLAVPGGPYRVLGNKLRSAEYKASALSSVLLHRSLKKVFILDPALHREKTEEISQTKMKQRSSKFRVPQVYQEVELALGQQQKASYFDDMNNLPIIGIIAYPHNGYFHVFSGRIVDRAFFPGKKIEWCLIKDPPTVAFGGLQCKNWLLDQLTYKKAYQLISYRKNIQFTSYCQTLEYQ